MQELREGQLPRSATIPAIRQPLEGSSSLLLRPWTIGINPALDLCDPLLMTKDQFRDLNDSPYEDRSDWHKPDTKTNDRVHHHVAPASRVSWWS
jgi:hypothetical protein